MGAEFNKQQATRFYEEVFNAGDMSVLDEVVADDFVDHEEVPGLSADKSGVAGWIQMFKAGFPDAKMTLLKMMADDEEVWVHLRVTGTHTGEFMGLKPTDQKIDIDSFDRVRVRDGKAVEHWGTTDMMAMMQQLGVMPMPE